MTVWSISDLVDLVTIPCPTCPVCGRTAAPRLVTAASRDAWDNGAHVQDAFPYLTADDRELLVTGTHPACWDTLKGDDE